MLPQPLDKPAGSSDLAQVDESGEFFEQTPPNSPEEGEIIPTSSEELDVPPPPTKKRKYSARVPGATLDVLGCRVA